jgi:hypothetical protein
VTWFTPQWGNGNNATAPARDVNFVCYFSNDTASDDDETSTYNETYSLVGPYDLSAPSYGPFDIIDELDYSTNNVVQFVSQTSVLVSNATNATNTTAAQPAKFW